jgi:hypothetical protein
VTVRYDITPAATTAYCDCGWRELRLTREGAWSAALEHETNVHPDRRGVREAARVRESRRHDLGNDLGNED